MKKKWKGTLVVLTVLLIVILLIIPFVIKVSEEVFHNELKRMLNTPEYRKNYSEEAIKIMKKYLAKEPLR